MKNSTQQERMRIILLRMVDLFWGEENLGKVAGKLPYLAKMYGINALGM